MTIAFYEHPFSSYVQKAKSMSARDPGCSLIPGLGSSSP